MRNQLRQPVVLLAATAVVVVVLGALFHASIDRQLRRWQLLPEPEKLTELYFTSPSDLPDAYAPGQTRTVSFTVHNLEYATTNYTYSVVETNQAGSQRQTLATSTFTLPQNGYKALSLQIPVADMGSRVKLEVDLENTHESIAYWLNKEAA